MLLRCCALAALAASEGLAWAAQPPQTKPRLSVVGPHIFKTGVTFAQEYDDPGADCSDQLKFNKNLNGDVAVGGDLVDLRKAATYVVEYYCSNGQAQAKATRTVIVSTQYNTNCTQIQVYGDPSGGAADGSYTLQSETHDGMPIYKQTSGSKNHHLYYYTNKAADAKQVVHRWNIEAGSLKKIRLSHWQPNAPHDGLRVVSYATEPSSIKDTWSAFNAQQNKWLPASSVSVSCSSTEKRNETDVFTVRGTVELMGYTKEGFDENKQYDFKVGVADGLDIPVNDVKIIKMEEVDKLFGSHRHHIGVGSGKRRRLREAHIFLTMPEGMNVWWQAQTVDGDVEADMLYRLKKTDFEMTLLQDFRMAGLRNVRTVFLNKTSIVTHIPESAKRMHMLKLGGGILALLAVAVIAEHFGSMRARPKRKVTTSDAITTTEVGTEEEQQGLTAGVDAGARAQEESAVGHTEAAPASAGGLEEEI